MLIKMVWNIFITLSNILCTATSTTGNPSITDERRCFTGNIRFLKGSKEIYIDTTKLNVPIYNLRDRRDGDLTITFALVNFEYDEKRKANPPSAESGISDSLVSPFWSVASFCISGDKEGLIPGLIQNLKEQHGQEEHKYNPETGIYEMEVSALYNYSAPHKSPKRKRANSLRLRIYVTRFSKKNHDHLYFDLGRERGVIFLDRVLINYIDASESLGSYVPILNEAKITHEDIRKCVVLKDVVITRLESYIKSCMRFFATNGEDVFTNVHPGINLPSWVVYFFGYVPKGTEIDHDNPPKHAIAMYVTSSIFQNVLMREARQKRVKKP